LFEASRKTRGQRGRGCARISIHDGVSAPPDLCADKVPRVFDSIPPHQRTTNLKHVGFMGVAVSAYTFPRYWTRRVLLAGYRTFVADELSRIRLDVGVLAEGSQAILLAAVESDIALKEAQKGAENVAAAATGIC
jgi:hypothetical protein